jgi:hypothetical protein
MYKRDRKVDPSVAIIFLMVIFFIINIQMNPGWDVIKHIAEILKVGIKHQINQNQTTKIDI